MSPNRHKRKTPAGAHGEVASWGMGAALALALVMIIGLLALIVVRGSGAFWPAPVELVQFAGEEAPLLGVREATREGPLGEEVRYRVANRDIRDETALWFPAEVVNASEISTPGAAAVVERDDWGDFFGFIEAVRVDGEVVASSDDPEWDSELRDVIRRGVQRRSEIESLSSVEIPRFEQRLREVEWARRRIERSASPDAERGVGTPTWAWIVAALAVPALGWGGWVAFRRGGRGAAIWMRVWIRGAAWAAFVAVALLGSLVVLEAPGVFAGDREGSAAKAIAELDAKEATLRSDLDRQLNELTQLRSADANHRLVVRDPATGRIAPRSQSTPDEPMLVSQATRVYFPNRLTLVGRIGVYLEGWRLYLTREPRSNGAEGGVWPVIVGTVTLTMLLTVCVLPLGVVAAIYLREYAKQGPLTSLIRIAINNLAGVPSIVYGMFGLGFFCYMLGGWIDHGPVEPVAYTSWWWGYLGAGAVVIASALLGGAALRFGASGREGLARAAKFAAGLGWVSAIVLAVWLVAKTPYFGGFFSEKLPEQPTFGGRGILWAALTLALLTLPVVIVATEEAISAVPGSMREGSLATGASRWQTIRRIVLPHAMPGVMTGAILAMARGAGEVAPLMLVGAVNYSPALPVSTDAPFLHGDRTFMHLGFHIYSVAFQSPDSEAAEPLVWTATFLLVGIVLVLNLAAIWIRARLARAHKGGGL